MYTIFGKDMVAILQTDWVLVYLWSWVKHALVVQKVQPALLFTGAFKLDLPKPDQCIVRVLIFSGFSLLILLNRGYKVYNAI